MNVSITSRKLLKRLRKLQSEVSHIDTLNRGGCGIFAYLVGQKLESFGIECEIVTPTDYHCKPAAVVRANVRRKGSPCEWDRNGLSRSHLALRFRTPNGAVYTYDSNALLKKSSWFGEGGRYLTSSEFGTGLTVEECKAICKPQRGWNRTFKRRKYVPQLVKAVEEVFSK